MRVLVVTCAHRGDDARIVHRQCASLLRRGHEVTLVSTPPADPSADPAGLRRVAIRRAVGRRRIGAWRDVRRVVDVEIAAADILVLHDPELVPLVRRRWRSVPVVWDVHEDFVASVRDRAWIPSIVRPAVQRIVTRLQRRALRTMHVTIAEHSYAANFPGAPMVPNSTWIPDVREQDAIAGRPEVVYVGRISHSRGVEEMIELGRRLGESARMVLVGPADANVADRLGAAHAAGDVDWRGPRPNPEALAVARRAVVGLSLLHDEPNYRHSMPTKLIEYMANGVPVISTPLALAVDLVTDSGGGEIVPFGDVASVAAAITRLVDEPALRAQRSAAGRAFVAEHHSWDVDGERFVDLLEGWVSDR